MEINDWYRSVTGGDSANAVAQRAHVVQTTLNRQVRAGRFTAEVVVAVARAYSAPVLDALVVLGLLTEREARLKKRMSVGLEEALKTAEDAQILRELLRRIEEEGREGHSLLATPLDEEHPVMKESTRTHPSDVSNVVPLRAESLPDATIERVELTAEQEAMPRAAKTSNTIKERTKKRAEDPGADSPQA